jgi:hypothetical protein
MSPVERVKNAKEELKTLIFKHDEVMQELDAVLQQLGMSLGRASSHGH